MRTFSVSKEIAILMLKADKIAAFRIYLAIKYYMAGKGNDFSQLAKELGLKVKYVEQKLAQLEKLGLMERKRNGWWFVVGTDRWCENNGIKYTTLVYTNETILHNIKILRNFIRSIQITMAGRAVRAAQRTKSANSREQRIPLSNSFLSRYMDVGERTVKRHKGIAKKNGFLLFKQRYTILKKGTYSDIPEWKEYRSSPSHVIRVIFGKIYLCDQLPSTLEYSILYKNRRTYQSKLNQSSQNQGAV